MHFDFGNLSVLIAAIALVLALALALLIEQRNRKRIEKPPQQEKLLRPPGHSLARRLDEAVDAIVFDILFACVMSGAAGLFVNLFVRFLAAGVPWRWIAIAGTSLGLFSLVGIFLVVRAFRRTNEVRNLRLGFRWPSQQCHRRGNKASLRSFLGYQGGAAAPALPFLN